MKTLPVSSFYRTRSPETQRKNVNFQNSNNVSKASRQQTQKASGNVKLDPNRLIAADVVKIISNHRATKNFPSESNQRTRVQVLPATVYRNDDDSISEAETVIDSLYDNENYQDGISETMEESEYEVENDVHDSFQSLQEGLNQITSNYVHDFKNQVEEAMSNLKVSEYMNPRPKLVDRIQERGGGDKIKKLPPKVIPFLKKAETEKQECYIKIQASLKRMKSIDNIVEEWMKSHWQCKH
jgi:hypothetical protein